MNKFKTIGKIMIVVITFLVIFIVGGIFLELGSSIYCWIKGYSKYVLFNSESFGTTVLMAVFQNVVAVATVLMFLKGNLKDKFDELKLTIKPNSHKLFFIGAFGGLIGILLITLLGLLTGITHFENIAQTSFSSMASRCFLSLILFLSVGFGEEILSRGYIVKQLLGSGSKLWAITMSAFIFMLFHIGTYSKLLDFVDVFLAGILLACMYIESKSLWLSIGFHFMWNFVQTFIFKIENQTVNPTSIFQFSVPKDIYMFGIDIGCKFEIIFILVELLLIASVLYIYKIINKKKIIAAV